MISRLGLDAWRHCLGFCLCAVYFSMISLFCEGDKKAVFKKKIYLYIYIYIGLPRWLSGKPSTCQVEDLGLILGLGRSPGEGNDNQYFQYSCLENHMNIGA